MNRLLGMAACVASIVFALAATDEARCERSVPYVRDDCFGRCSFGKTVLNCEQLDRGLRHPDAARRIR